MIQQLIVISRIASTNTDMSTYNKRGEVNQILRNIFVNTSTADIIHTMIPALTGTLKDTGRVVYRFWISSRVTSTIAS